MTDLCREFGISRKTGYKIFDRYKEHGLEALSDRSLPMSSGRTQ
jgi:putative transposase